MKKILLLVSTLLLALTLNFGAIKDTNNALNTKDNVAAADVQIQMHYDPGTGAIG
ncbi:hypothetical protein GLW05_14770 [Pontibacillus yanchengensis]|uniref:Phr family secreted Rap phosphatase inhibitor n=1 Tax=Pontibacillus yanchengensis TaxID=462910 RepID=A0A6I4ZXH3_9BACI|nr:hypothetical protein [Pontibacillus yanchengensis]MYL34855.1 hypothetical protein [Pontibacillus yanchengensis]